MIQQRGINLSHIEFHFVERKIGLKGSLQEPKIKPHIPKMIEAIAATLGIPRTDISIKATTTEQLGFVGREEGVMAYASVLIDKH